MIDLTINGFACEAKREGDTFALGRRRGKRWRELPWLYRYADHYDVMRQLREYEEDRAYEMRKDLR